MNNAMNPSNVISLLRGPLAFLFLFDNVLCRTIVIFLAMLSDSLDGYLARRYGMTTQLGATLDALMDKFFVTFILSVFFFEEKIHGWEMVSFFARDFAVLIFAFYLALKGFLCTFRIRAIWSGKIMTSLQFLVLLGLTFHIRIPTAFFYCFLALGVAALVELFLIEKQTANI